MAPELFEDGSRPSEASDIYALGMVTYEVGPHYVSGELILKSDPAGFRTRGTILSDLFLSRTWTGSQR